MEIRLANANDADGIIKLLYQVNQIHADGRNDLFKSGGIKYTKESLIEKFSVANEYIYVAVEDDNVLGYAFCVINDIEENTSLYPRRELYIDDLCVDENERGRHIGKQLYAHVQKTRRINTARFIHRPRFFP